MANPVIGFTTGDINGIGLEVILKTLREPLILKNLTPVIFGSGKVVSYHKNIVARDAIPFHQVRVNEPFRQGVINVVNVWQDNVPVTLGEINETGGRYAADSLQAAMEACRSRSIDALVTAPIHKKAMDLAGFGYPGHTEFLTAAYPGRDSLMILATDELRVGIVTGHVALSEVSPLITKERIIAKAQIFIQSLKIDFGINKPRLAVLGLNPHAGDNGLFGEEEQQQIIPAIMELKKEGHIVQGPFAADGFFGAGTFKSFDGILAMYHDQGLIPFKALSFGSGVNFTAGLPIIRTSPDHGTGFELAGKNEASEKSLRSALFLAVDLIRNRNEYHYYQKHKLKKNELEEEPDVSEEN